jgi:hypothetical protein
MQINAEKKKRLAAAKRLVNSVKNKDLEDFRMSDEDKSTIEQEKSSEDSTKVENQLSFLLEKRADLRAFVDEILSIINEIHFICEYGHLLLQDRSLAKEKATRVSQVIRSLETIVWGLTHCLESGNGIAAIVEIRKLYKKALNSIRILRNFSV